MIDKIALGNRITEYRQKKEITVQELVDRADISKSYLMSICNGKGAIPTLDILSKLAGALNTSVDMLLIDSLCTYQTIEAKKQLDHDSLQLFYSLNLEDKELILQYMRDFKLYKTLTKEDQPLDISPENEPDKTNTGYIPDIVGELKDISEDMQYEFLSIIKSMKKINIK